MLIAAAAIATSFFGTRAFADGGSTAWTWIAVLAFALIGVCVLTVLWPRTDWSFNASASDLIATYIEPDPLSLPEIHRDLALHRSAAYDANADQLEALFLVFRAGLVLLVLETAAWIVALADGA